MANISAFLSASQIRVNAFLKTVLPQGDNQLHQAMRYAIGNGGKRIRPVLIYAVADTFGQLSHPGLDYLAAAIECMHSYSLVHDDLPAMDDDELRRGMPSCHIEFDEATAILCGDALQCFSFELLSNSAIPSDRVAALVRCFAKKSGFNGMALGQHYDLVGRANTEHELLEMHTLKTGRLIEAAIEMPAILLDQISAEDHAALSRYAKHLGLAFQICDDILDCTQSTEALGKPAQSDMKNEKHTYVSFYGLDEATRMLNHEVGQAKEAIVSLSSGPGILDAIADYFLLRTV